MTPSIYNITVYEDRAWSLNLSFNYDITDIELVAGYNNAGVVEYITIIKQDANTITMSLDVTSINGIVNKVSKWDMYQQVNGGEPEPLLEGNIIKKSTVTPYNNPI